MWLSFNFSPFLRPFGFDVSLSPSPWPCESWFRQFCSQHAHSLLLYISGLKTFLTVIYSKTYFTSSSHKYTKVCLDIAKKVSQSTIYPIHCILIVYFLFHAGKYCWSPLNQFHDLLMVCILQVESHLFKECSGILSFVSLVRGCSGCPSGWASLNGIAERVVCCR